MKNYKLLTILLSALVAFVFMAMFYFDYLKDKKTQLKTLNYSKEAIDVRDSFQNLILEKQNSTLAIAISLADDKTLISSLKEKKIDENKYKKLSQDYRESTLYKNIWIQILDNKGVSLYRSWNHKKGDSLLPYRHELKDFFSEKKSLKVISVGKYDLTIKSMVPIMDGKSVLGALEVISHFNSIAKLMETMGRETVLVLKEKYSKQLEFPFTKLFIDDKYYVANVNASKGKMERLSKNGVENYFEEGYKVENGHLVVSTSIRDVDDDILGYSIVFEKQDLISTLESEFFLFKWISALVIILLTIISALSMQLFIKNKSQKAYYKNILDSVTNIVLVNDKKSMLDVNEIFFKYFSKYQNIEDFKREHICVCEFFVDEEGYLQKKMDGLEWVDYLLKSRELNHKVKMKIEDEIYYFFVSASYLPALKDKYIVVFSDITSEEEYLSLSLTDELTKIGNKRYFNVKLASEISRARRHDAMLSLVMFDIDFFKKVNDVRGHDVGDEVLSQYSGLILTQLREEDAFCRIGGEEFTIILPHTDIENAKRIAEKLRGLVENSHLVLPITMSFGVVEHEEGETKDAFFKRADTALYCAKENGRNMVVVG